MSLSSSERAIFQDTGILYVKSLVAQGKIKAAREAVLTELERLKYRTNGKWQTKQAEDSSPFKLTTKIAASIRSHAAFSALLIGEVKAAIDSLAEENLSPAQAHPQILVSLPQKQPWTLPYLGWHLDLAAPSPKQLAGIQPFVLIDDLEPQGGATLAIAGSHRLHPAVRGQGPSVHETLKGDREFGALFSEQRSDDGRRFFKPCLVGGFSICVVEMCGKAGDVFLMDMRVLHAPALNARKKPRLMATGRFLKAAP